MAFAGKRKSEVSSRALRRGPVNAKCRLSNLIILCALILTIIQVSLFNSPHRGSHAPIFFSDGEPIQTKTVDNSIGFGDYSIRKIVIAVNANLMENLYIIALKNHWIADEYTIVFLDNENLYKQAKSLGFDAIWMPSFKLRTILDILLHPSLYLSATDQHILLLLGPLISGTTNGSSLKIKNEILNSAEGKNHRSFFATGRIKDLRTQKFYVVDNQLYFMFPSSVLYLDIDPPCLAPMSDYFFANYLWSWAVTQSEQIVSYDLSDVLDVMHLDLQLEKSIRLNRSIIQSFNKQKNLCKKFLKNILISDADFRIIFENNSSTLSVLSTNSTWPSPHLLESLSKTYVAGDKKSRFILAGSPNCGYVDIALNWLYHIVNIAHVDNFILFPKDYRALRVLETVSPGHSIAAPKELTSNRFLQTFSFGKRNFKKLVAGRPDKISKILDFGVSVLWSDMDIVYYRNPFPHLFNHHVTDDIVLQNDNGRYCTGLIFLVPGLGPQSLLSDWKRDINDSYDDQSAFQEHALNLISHKGVMVRNGSSFSSESLFPLKVGFFDSRIFVGGKSYFEDKDFDSVNLIAVHNNWIRAHWKKVDRFQRNDMWKIDKLASKLLLTEIEKNSGLCVV